jgi:pimeloyl-ACP methyl ester carboxylesterase
MPARIIRVAVPERRAHPGRTITIAALKIPAKTGNPGRPIVFLMGGPGIPGTVMAPIPPYFTLFDRLRDLGDVILLDQRGLGGSQPNMDCPVEQGLMPDFFATRDRMVNVMRGRVASCAAHWRRQGDDPTAYNTIESADDVDDIRAFLGVDQIDLLAFSYGTRLALAVLQRHGAHVGRLVLQGVNGPGLVLKRPAAVTRKLQRISDLLKRDSTWRGTSDLLSAASAARIRLARTPATVDVTDRRTGQPMRLSISRDGFDAIVSLNLDDARLPALLVSVAAGDDRVLARFVESVWNGMGSGTVGLMGRAVNCAADRPPSRRQLIAKEVVAAPFGEAIDNAVLTDDFCRAVGYHKAPVEFPQRLTSSVPTLLLTGTLDATNPVENADDVARGLIGAVTLDVENAAHEALPVPAVQDAVVDFLRGTDVRGRRIVAPAPHFPTVEEALQPQPSRRN